MARPSHALPAPLRAAEIPEVVNHTSWPSQYFQHVDPLGEVFHVMVSRISYSMLDLEETTQGKIPKLLPPDMQRPLCEADEFIGSPNASSTLQESDFAPYKPKCDVLLVNATAHSPTGQALPRWPVGFRFGNAIEKKFHVTGPRQFERSVAHLGMLQLTEPAPVAYVPVSYELAFGGPNTIQQANALQSYVDGPWGMHGHAQGERARKALASLPSFWGGNPIGCGRHPRALADANEALAEIAVGTEDVAPPGATNRWRQGPQIEVFDRPYVDQRDYPVVGVGPIGRWWSPRVALAGTHDAQWKQAQWPKSPHDHDYRYWNCAPEDQQIDFPNGGEEVVLANFTSAALHKGPYRFLLPRQDLQLLVRMHSGVVLFSPMNIDTVVMDMGCGVLGIVRRAVVSAKAGVRQLELGTWPQGSGLMLDDDMVAAAQANAARK